MAILSDDMQSFERFILHSKVSLTAFVILILSILPLAACSGQQSAEATPLSPAMEDSLPDEDANQPAAQPIAQTLPTPVLTLLPPASPTPAPTMALDPAAAGTAAIGATRAAAIAPPTPPIIPSATTESIFNEPMPTPSGIYSWTLKVPILMYHYISEPPPDADVYRVDLSVSPDAFRQQMAYLRDNGYTTIDLYDLSTAIVSQAELPEKPVLLTFDDGYLDNYEHAYPTLQEFGFKGTFFVISEFIDKGLEGYMTWQMVEEMARAGQRIESHSRTHPDLTEKEHDGLIWEILGSQETIAAHIGYRPRYFCYPGGDYNAATIEMLRELDFWGALTTENGNWHGFNDRFEWSRLRMRNDTSIEEFARLVDLEGTVRGKPTN